MEQRTLGRYRIVAELGRGAMGAVYRAVDPLIDRDVAIKTLLPNLPEEIMDEVRERFLREARSAGRLNHPNIVTVFDVGEQDGVAYIAMELLEGRSLQLLLREPQRLALETIAEIVAQIADALDHAQQYKIVHRDVKPANVMVAPSGRCKLTDFGVAYVPTSTMTQTGAALGSPRYMSPEQALGVPVDGRSDIFSLGIVLYEMLARRNPFERPGDTTPLPILHRIAAEPHVPVREIDPQIPAAFDRILARALAKKPQHRYQRAVDMAADLRKAATEAPAGTPAYEKTVLIKPQSMSDQLLGDLDDFAKKFELEEQARLREAEAERLRKEEEMRRREAEQRKRETETARAAEPNAAPARRSGALDALRKQAATLPPKEDPAVARARARVTLDHDMRAAYQYLAEFAKEVNSLGPAASSPYDYPLLGRIASVSLSDAWVDSRPRHIEGKDYCAQIMFRYRINPDPPLKLTLLRDDIQRVSELLKSLRADFDTRVETKNDFGQPLRAVLTIKGKLLCELDLRADYDNFAVGIELNNLRRTGKAQCRLAAAEFKDIADDLARYMLGVDADFERLLHRAG